MEVQILNEVKKGADLIYIHVYIQSLKHCKHSMTVMCWGDASGILLSQFQDLMWQLYFCYEMPGKHVLTK